MKVKKKGRGKDKKHLLYLTCQECGKKFTADRYRKYCLYTCQREVNNRLAKMRYAEMRDIYLKSKGVIE